MKKTLLVLISLLLIFTLFTGCGEDFTSTPESLPADTQEVDTTAEDEQDTELDETKKNEVPTGELKATSSMLARGMLSWSKHRSKMS